jgi:hypothetical protein
VERKDVFHSERALEALLSGSRDSSVTGDVTGDEASSIIDASAATGLGDAVCSVMD